MVLIENKEHLTLEGLQQIVNIRSSMNLGLSDLQKAEFSNFKPVERKIINTQTIPDPQWIARFVCGEGYFEVIITNSKSNKLGKQVRLRFSITQHERDINLMSLILNYFGSGKIYKDPRGPTVYLRVEKFEVNNKIINPFFIKYKINGVKQLDFQDWSLISKLMVDGKHKTQEGLDLIHRLKSNMNQRRKFD